MRPGRGGRRGCARARARRSRSPPRRSRALPPSARAAARARGPRSRARPRRRGRPSRRRATRRRRGPPARGPPSRSPCRAGSPRRRARRSRSPRGRARWARARGRRETPSGRARPRRPARTPAPRAPRPPPPRRRRAGGARPGPCRAARRPRAARGRTGRRSLDLELIALGAARVEHLLGAGERLLEALVAGLVHEGAPQRAHRPFPALRLQLDQGGGVELPAVRRLSELLLELALLLLLHLGLLGLGEAQLLGALRPGDVGEVPSALRVVPQDGVRLVHPAVDAPDELAEREVGVGG